MLSFVDYVFCPVFWLGHELNKRDKRKCDKADGSHDSTTQMDVAAQKLQTVRRGCFTHIFNPAAKQMVTISPSVPVMVLGNGQRKGRTL